MRLVDNALPGKLSQAMEDQALSVRGAARRCNLTPSRFADVLYGRSRRPQPDTLQAIASGLGLSYRELALAAYGVISDPVQVPASA